MQKGKKLNNKSSECNTRFDDPYILYENNIGINDHHNRHRNKQTYWKKENSNNKNKNSNTRLDDTYLFLYRHNIGIDYHHIRKRDEERYIK